MTKRSALFVVFMLLGWAGVGFAQELPEDLPPSRESEQADDHAPAHREIPPPADEDPHPVLPRDATWAGIMLIVIVGGF